MKKQNFILIVGLALASFASSASNVTATNRASALAVGHPRLKQKKRSSPRVVADAAKAVKTRLTELFRLCKSDDLDAAAAYFVYRDADESRKWKDVYRASDPAEMAVVRDICLRIKSYLDESDGYQFGAFKVEKEAEGKWHALEVSFHRGDKVKKAIFAFLLIKGQFAIGDID